MLWIFILWRVLFSSLSQKRKFTVTFFSLVNPAFAGGGGALNAPTFSAEL